LDFPASCWLSFKFFYFSKQGGTKVKRAIIGVAAAAAAATSAVVIPSVAGASGSTTGSSVSINQYADWDTFGGQLDVGVNVSCTGGTGVVNVDVYQPYPETYAPTGATGSGFQPVVCDGRTRYVTVTITGAPFDGGKATAKATLTPLSGPTAMAQRQITIRAV
jgi:hypothetical protein